MKDGYNNMFAISEVKRRFIDAESGQSVNYSGVQYNVSYKYDLPNDNIYTLDGKLFKTADQVSNNTSYLLYLIHAEILEVKPFLHYQFSKTPDEELFLDYTEYGIAGHKSISEAKGKLINDWVKEQRENLKSNTIESNNNTGDDFFLKISNQLYTYDYKIQGFDYLNCIDFIEAMHEICPVKGKIFYGNLIHAMPSVGQRIADSLKGEVQTPKEKVFMAVCDYCSSKLNNSEGKVGDHEKMPRSSKITLQTTLSEKQITILHKLLLKGSYIKDINIVDLIYWLTGKPLLNDVPKIKWNKGKGKGMAIQLFKAICLGLTYSKLNNCVEVIGKNFDSNHVSKVGYDEIDTIIKQVKG